MYDDLQDLLDGLPTRDKTEFYLKVERSALQRIEEGEYDWTEQECVVSDLIQLANDLGCRGSCGVIGR